MTKILTGNKLLCKVCNHAGKVIIDTLLLNGVPYAEIIRKMDGDFPNEPGLNEANLSRHKARHLQNRPITVETEDENGEVQIGFLAGPITAAPVVNPRHFPAPDDRVEAVPALDMIINIGLRNALANPEMVNGKVLLDALALRERLKKQGLGEDFDAAWDALGTEKSKGRPKRKVTRTVTVSEEKEVSPETIVDVTPTVPAVWSEDDLKLLEVSVEQPIERIEQPAPARAERPEGE